MSLLRDRRHRHAGTLARSTASIGLVAAVLLAVTGLSLAEEDPRPQKTEARALNLRLDRERLTPRVSTELESICAFGSVEDQDQTLHDHVLFDEMSAAVRRSTKSVTRRMVRDQLLEAVNLDRGIERVRESIFGNRLNREHVDYHFGIYRGLPQVGFRYRRGYGSFRFTLGGDGAVGLKFKDRRVERAEIGARYDGEDTYSLRVHFAF